MIADGILLAPIKASLRAERSNPEFRAQALWIAASLRSSQ